MLELEELDESILMSEETSDDKQYQSELSQLQDMLPTILKEFKSAGLEKYYIKFNTLVHSGQFDFANIAFLLFCDVVQFLSLESTTQMRYDIPATRKFWYLSHLLFQGRLQRFMTGYKNMGSVKSGKEEPGYYAPSETRINFAVPNDMTKLMPSDVQVPEVNGPGKFNEMINALSDNNCTYILTFDGKKLAPGLTKDSGDVDLLGHETGPSLQAREEDVKTKLADVSELRAIMMRSHVEIDESIQRMLASDKTALIPLLKAVHKTLSNTVKGLRVFISKKMYMLDSFKVRNEKADGKKYNYVIDSIKTILYRSQSVVKNAMAVIDDICKSIAILQGSSDSFATSSSLSLENLNNFVSLNEPETVAIALELPDTKDVPPPIVKQRTPEWQVIRKQALVTGSSAYYCLGLESLKRQKEEISRILSKHVEKEVKDKQENERSAAMEHGIKNEINALATLSSKILPVYYPDSTYFEEGCYLFEEEGDTVMEVSPDGSVRQITDIDYEDEDEMIRSTKQTQFAVEVKCPYPAYKYAVPVYYTLPERYVCQIMSEMKVLECQEALLVSWSPESTTAFRLKFSDAFFETMSGEIKDVFLNGTPKQPKRKSECAKVLKSMSKEISEAAEFIGEFKSVTSVQSEFTHSKSGVYTSHLNAKYPSDTKADMSVNDMLSSLKMVEDIINESYQIQRQKASEIMPILLSSVHREWNPETGHATPIGYFLRGYSLSTDVMRNIADDFQEECYKKGIYVPIQTFDGQWLRLVVRDNKDNPQTELEFAKDHWSRVKKLSKPELVAKFKTINKSLEVQRVDAYENATETPRFTLFVTSKTPGDSVKMPRMKNKVASEVTSVTSDIVDDQTFDQLSDEAVSQVSLENAENEFNENDSDLAPSHFKLPSNNGNVVQLDDEINIEQLWPDHIEMEAPESEWSGTEIGDAIENEDSTIVNPGNDASELQTHGHTINITDENLSLILQKFQNGPDGKAWHSKTVDDLKSCLKDGASLCSLKDVELKEIIKCLKPVAKQQNAEIIPKVSDPKKMKVQKLCKLLGLCDSGIEENTTRRRKKIPSLQTLAGRQLSSKYPKEVLAAAYAEYSYKDEVSSWRATSHITHSVNMAGLNRQFIPFYHPFWSPSRRQLEVKVIDGTHIRTNLRGAICRNSILGLDKKAWEEVSLMRTTPLTPTLLEIQADGKVLDQQKDSFARTMFCEQVEIAMVGITNSSSEPKFAKEAKFCKLIRNWTKAEDLPGLSAHERISYALDLRDWLLTDINFGEFPIPGKYIKGIPKSTFQALLCNLEAHVYLYNICKEGTYNWRSISSLVAESFMSEIDYMDNWSRNGVLTAYGAKMHMKTVCSIHAIQHDPERGFHMKLSKAPTYQIQEADFNASDIPSRSTVPVSMVDPSSKISTIIPRNHVFDSEKRLEAHRQKPLGTVSHPDAPARGTQPIRSRYRLDESRMLDSKRLGKKLD